MTYPPENMSDEIDASDIVKNKSFAFVAMLMITTYLMIIVAIIGMPIGTVFFATVRKDSKGKITDNLGKSMKHFFNCGIITLILLGVAYAIRLAWLKFNQPTPTF
jgi:hypothetical protein